jgi:hypothetical protein
MIDDRARGLCRWTSRLLVASCVVVAASVAVGQAPPHPSLPQCDPNDPELLLPDLIPDPPRDVREAYSGGRRHLQFTTAVGNIGDGPLLVEGRTISTPAGLVTQAYQLIWRRDGSRCARPAGQFEYHQRHRHWHFERFVGYELRRDDALSGDLVAGGAKTSFCLLDLETVRGYHPSRTPRQLSALTCKSPEGIQGISVGWKDVYQRTLPGQSINLDPDPTQQVPQGFYHLVNVADPDHQLWEKTRANNIGSVPIRVNLTPPAISGQVIESPAPVPQNPRPRPARPVRPARPPRPGQAPRPTVATPAPSPVQAPTPVPTVASPAGSCENACPYAVSQLRMTWYDNLGLQLSALINPGACPSLAPAPGQSGEVRMAKWLTQDRRDLGRVHATSFSLGASRSGRTTNGATVTFGSSGRAVTFSYRDSSRPFARARDGADFPVQFELCLTVGEQAVKMRLVCQPKSTGMLCH